MRPSRQLVAASLFLRRHHAAVAAALLACMALLLGHAAFVDSPTIDEPNHIARGLAFWWSGDSRLSTAHPPLANALQALPAALLDEPIDFEKLKGWPQADIGRVARALVAKDYEQLRSAIVTGRLVTGLLTLLLGLYLYRYCLRWGRGRALFFLLLFVCSPVLLAHGHLVTTDLPVALCFAVAVGEGVRWLEGGSRWRLAFAAAAAGCAAAAKFSGVLLLPVLGAATAATALAGVGRFAGATWPARIGRVLRAGLFTGLVVLTVVNGAYRFERSFWTVRQTLAAPEPANWITRPHRGLLLERLSPLADMPRQVRLPVPYSWLFGLFSIEAQNERGHGGWFLGSTEPTRLYFPTMLAIKSPAALLLLLAGAAALWLRRAGRWPARLVERLRAPSSRLLRPLAVPHLALWAAPLLLFWLALGSKIQIGVRHVLPVVPFLLLAAAWAGALLWRRQPALAGLLALLLVAEVALVHPGHLGHFSLLVGGPPVGHQISMIGEDWGQDVAALGTVAKEAGLAPLHYVPYGITAVRELRRTGLKFRTLSCKTRKLRNGGWIAIHAAQLLRWKKCGPIDATRPPDRTIGEHIWLYRVDPPAAR